MRHRATPVPDRILLTWAADPATSAAVTWRTYATVQSPVAQIAVAVNLSLDPATDVLTVSTTLTNQGDAPLEVQWLAAAVQPLPGVMSVQVVKLHRWGGHQCSELTDGFLATGPLQVPLERAGQRALPVALRRVHHHAGGFVDDDQILIDVDDRGIQTLLREVPGDLLQRALKGSDDQMREKVFKNMSSRAAEGLREDLESRGPVRLSEVEAAQKDILKVVRKLADAGTIQLGGGGDDAFV
mgnify:CR=1 FL=1